ncbi:hypothetical protein Pyrde_1128 [Pyrodictium delaneyi]|uniref:Uncharacterized protein n=1 Tax=Pyrodictium delaneyi TaxID=1273541 RepID=A0A0P0N3S4_9CREN|nr:hypothetical protein [Pyrodictium delaneyi]ALL01176.1 hypothetical protein Pyrde_1128 [Pyrodictium delaneyi]
MERMYEKTCPRCRTRMEYRVEMEFGENGMRRIRYYYRCPRCGYRLQDLVIVVKRGDNGGVIVEREEYIERKTERNKAAVNA